MSILEELWYGNIDPMEAVGCGGHYYKELMVLMAKNREKIAATLTEEMQEVLCGYGLYQIQRYDRRAVCLGVD